MINGLQRNIEYKETIEYINGYKIIHSTPVLTNEKIEERKKEALTKLVNLLSNRKK